MIDRAMTEKRLNQPELSRRSGVPQATISRTLKGRSIPNTENLIKLFSALDIPLNLIEGHEYHSGERSPSEHLGEAHHGGYNVARAVPLLPPAVTIDLDPDCLVVWRQLQQLPERAREEWLARLGHAAAAARLQKLGIEPPPEPPPAAPTTAGPKATQSA